MTKKKFNRFLDVVTVLVILFPLIMCLITARSTGTFEHDSICDYVNQFAIVPDFADSLIACLDVFDFPINGAFGYSAFVIMSNAVFIWILRLFLEVLTFVPKMSIKFLRMFGRGDDV